MKKLLTVAIIGLVLTGCAASQISLTASAPKGKDLDITIKTKEQKAEQDMEFKGNPKNNVTRAKKGKVISPKGKKCVFGIAIVSDKKKQRVRGYYGVDYGTS